jgi:hypothetical protein
VSHRDGNFEVYTMSADGSSQTRLTNGGGGGPVFSPDGTKIAYSTAGEINVMNADGTGQTRLTNSPEGEGNLDWGPLAGPTLPTSKGECKKGGYKEFGFKNQGQCIASLQKDSKEGEMSNNEKVCVKHYAGKSGKYNYIYISKQGYEKGHKKHGDKTVGKEYCKKMNEDEKGKKTTK